MNFMLLRLHSCIQGMVVGKETCDIWKRFLSRTLIISFFKNKIHLGILCDFVFIPCICTESKSFGPKLSLSRIVCNIEPGLF